MKELEMARQLLLRQMAEADVLFPSDQDNGEVISKHALKALEELIKETEQRYSAD